MKNTKQRLVLRRIALVLLVGACAGAFYLHSTGSRRALAYERELCRKAGLPLFQAEWPTAKVPMSLDAVPLYKPIDAALDRHSLGEADYELVGKLRSGDALTDAEVARLRSVFSARRDVFVALDRAMGKPLYSFGKDPDPEAISRELMLSRRRETVMLVCAKGVLLAHDSRYDEAVRTVAKGYRIGQHIDSIPSSQARSTGSFIDSVTSRSLGAILRIAGTDRRAATVVREAVRSAPQRPLLSFCLRNDCAIEDAAFRDMRQGYYDDFASAFPERDSTGTTVEPSKWSLHVFVLRHVPFAYHALVDSIDAASLRARRGIVTHADLPYGERRDWIRSQRLALNPGDTDNAHPLDLYKYFEGRSADEANTLAHRSVTLAAANVLIYRSRTGRLPYLLSEADSDMPLDPFSGKPLQYQLDGKGGFTISSVGQSAEDVSPEGYKRRPVVFHWGPH